MGFGYWSDMKQQLTQIAINYLVSPQKVRKEDIARLFIKYYNNIATWEM
jgi:hypothetical protein